MTSDQSDRNDARPPTDRLPEGVDTERLVLRRWCHDEARILHQAVSASVEHLRPWMPWVKFEPLTVDERVHLIEGWTRNFEAGGEVHFSVFADGEIVGGAGLHPRSEVGSLDIGYWIHVDHVGQGFATELTAALTTAAFEVDRIEVVHVKTDEANTASAAVPAKLGFTRSRVIEREPLAPGESGREIDWTMTSDDWMLVHAR